MLNRFRNNRKYGFTLIELLVVISIIALLIGLILPALSSAQKSAKSIECLNQQKQMGIAVVVYQEDHQSYFPPARYDDNDGTYAWDVIERNGVYSAGLLWQDVGVQDINRCPSFLGEGNNGNAQYNGYNYNSSYIGTVEYSGSGQAVNPKQKPAKIAQIMRPTQTAVFGDGGYAGGANKFMRAPNANDFDIALSNRWRYAGTQAYRHADATNITFADGHVASQSDRFTDYDGDPARITSETGFLSTDNGLYDLK